MASSKKLPSDPVSIVAHILKKRAHPGQRLLLALSGGLDSVVLLDILAQLRPSLGFSLEATHVNHQLSPHAGEWARFCATLCQRYDVALEIVPVTVVRNGQGLEAAARNSRHAVLARSGADHILLAHHLDDQSETLLLHLLRGGGVAGASAMPEQARRLLRPLLEVPRSTLERYARAHQLAWVEDESNLDTRFDRNFLRHHLLPLIAERFPAYRETLSRASHHFAESALLLDELARIDALGAVRDGKLSTTAIARLSLPRARNLLRHFLKQHGITAPSAARLENMLHQLLHARKDSQIRIPLGALELRRFLDQAWIVPAQAAPASGFIQKWEGEENILLPELGGTLKFCASFGQGISVARLQREPVTIRLRQGGERLQPDCRRPHRSLKNLCQEAAIPPWSRRVTPLVYSGKQLVAMVGIGIDCAFQATADEPGLMLEWHLQDDAFQP